MDRYEVIADVKELEWFFDNILVKPKVNESYSAVFCARYKKLSEEERAGIGLSKKDAEFMAAQTFRLKKFHDASDLIANDGWSFSNFLKNLKRFNVDKGAYLTTGGQPLPDKCLATIFYVNPCDELKVATEVLHKLDETKMAIVKAMLNGKSLDDNLQSYQAFCNLESKAKHARAHCKGSVYWLDYDLDCPEWMKHPGPSVTIGESLWFGCLREYLDTTYKRGNYIIVDTSGGYHILVRTTAIHENPYNFCGFAKDVYIKGIQCGYAPHVGRNGADSFECIVNDSQIPGVPLPGTYQYGRPVRVINKEDF